MSDTSDPSTTPTPPVDPTDAVQTEPVQTEPVPDPASSSSPAESPTPDSSVPVASSEPVDAPAPDPSVPPPDSPILPVEGVSDSPAPVQETTPEVVPDPVPAPSPTPTVVDGPLQQQTFHDTREIEAAQRAGLTSPRGLPLNDYALDQVRRLSVAVGAIEDWAKELRKAIDNIITS